MKPTKQQELVYKMLTENTGIHMMDSGGADGRGWQRNQKKTIEDFINEPHAYINDSYEDETYPAISVFHHLSNEELFQLDASCNKFNKKFNVMDNWDGIGYGVSEEATKWLEEQGFDMWSAKTFNTYNFECLLDQTLQGTTIRLCDDLYVLLQIHNGADVRGGYTDAKLFKLPTEYMEYGNVEGTIDGQEVTTAYDGYSLTTHSGEHVQVREDSKIELTAY